MGAVLIFLGSIEFEIYPRTVLHAKNRKLNGLKYDLNKLTNTIPYGFNIMLENFKFHFASYTVVYPEVVKGSADDILQDFRIVFALQKLAIVTVTPLNLER